MGPAVVIARAEARRTWRALLLLLVIVALAAGATLALVAGARRSASVVDRYRSAHLAADFVVQPDSVTAEDLEALRAAPPIADVAQLVSTFARPEGSDADFLSDELRAQVAIDGRYGDRIDRGDLVAGQRLDPSDASGLLVSESLAQELGLAPGERLTLETLTAEQIVALIFEGRAIGEPAGPDLELVVRGIVRPPTEVLGVASGGSLELADAVWERHGAALAFEGEPDPSRFSGFDNILLVRSEPDQLGAAIAAARSHFAGEEELFVDTGPHDVAGVRGQAHVVAVALALAAAVAAVATAVVGVQAVARHIESNAPDVTTLAALGMRRRERVAVLALPVAGLAVLASLLAPVVALVASSLFPTGGLRPLEPDRGTRVDAGALVGGALTLGAILAVAVVVLAVRAERTHRVGSPRKVSAALARGGLISSTATRLATARGVPVRPAMVGAVVALAGVAGAVTFGSSLERFVASPIRDGWSFDVEVGVGDELDDAAAIDAAQGLARREGVDAVMLARVGSLGVGARGDDIQVFGLEPISGTIPFTVLEGRMPSSPDEVVVGPGTADRERAGLGDHITVDGIEPQRMEVVGIVRFPLIEGDDPADGLAMTLDALAELMPVSEDEDPFGFPTAFVELDGAAGQRSLRDLSFTATLVRSPDATNLAKVRSWPNALAAGLALLGAVAVAHALVLAVRRQRRDLAVLRTVGFTRGQVARTVGFQALAYGALGLAVGVPVGLAIGRTIWRVLADSIGIAPDPLTPASLWVVLPATLALVVLLALGPARSAARAQAAAALRAE